MPSIFEWIMEKANLNIEEMYRTFNCGIGFVVIVDSSDVPMAREILEANGEEVTQLGQIKKRESNENLVTYI
jgi:phosphoribosylformylglycinamidine cyclo-ligase